MTVVQLVWLPYFAFCKPIQPKPPNSQWVLLQGVVNNKKVENLNIFLFVLGTKLEFNQEYKNELQTINYLLNNGILKLEKGKNDFLKKYFSNMVVVADEPSKFVIINKKNPKNILVFGRLAHINSVSDSKYTTFLQNLEFFEIKNAEGIGTKINFAASSNIFQDSMLFYVYKNTMQANPKLLFKGNMLHIAKQNNGIYKDSFEGSLFDSTTLDCKPATLYKDSLATKSNEYIFKIGADTQHVNIWFNTLQEQYIKNLHEINSWQNKDWNVDAIQMNKITQQPVNQTTLTFDSIKHTIVFKCFDNAVNKFQQLKYIYSKTNDGKIKIYSASKPKIFNGYYSEQIQCLHKLLLQCNTYYFSGNYILLLINDQPVLQFHSPVYDNIFYRGNYRNLPN